MLWKCTAALTLRTSLTQVAVSVEVSHICTTIISDGLLSASGCAYSAAGAVIQSLDNTAGRAIPPLRLGLIPGG